MSNIVAIENWQAYVQARDAGHDRWLKEADRAEDFYIGGGRQWDEADRKRLEAEGRPVLEINLVLSTINALLGERIAQRAEIRFAPLRSGSIEVAESILTPLARHIQEDNAYHFVEGEVFQDGLITGRGFFDIRIDYSRDVRGEVRITPLDPRSVVPDPAAIDYDTRKWSQVITTRLMTLDEIDAEYGKEHRDAIQPFMYGLGAPFDFDFIQRGFGDPEGLERVRIVERQYRKMTNCRFFVDNRTGDMRPILDMPEDRAREIADRLDLSIIERRAPRIRWTVTCGNHVLKDVWSPYDHFTVVGYFPYFVRGKTFGVVSNLISPQQQLNKAESQELHIINTTANSGWIVEAGSLLNMTEDDLEARGAETGLVMVVRQGASPPAKIQPNQIPTGITNVANKAASAIRAISGVNDAFVGQTSPELSGRAIEARIQRGTVQMQVVFDNLNRTRQIIGEIIYDLIRSFYTEERVYHVADFATGQLRSVEINKQLFDGTVLHDITVGEYAVRVSSGPSADSVQDEQFNEALQLRKAGVAIPDYALVENSHLLHRQELAALLRKLQGFAEPTPEEQQLAQLRQRIEYETIATQLAMNKAKAALLQAQAQQAAAKARELDANVQTQAIELQAKIEHDMRELEQRWAEVQASLAAKMQIAGIHAGVKSELTRFTTRAKLTEAERARHLESRRGALRGLRSAIIPGVGAGPNPIPTPGAAGPGIEGPGIEGLGIEGPGIESFGAQGAPGAGAPQDIGAPYSEVAI